MREGSDVREGSQGGDAPPLSAARAPHLDGGPARELPSRPPVGAAPESATRETIRGRDTAPDIARTSSRRIAARGRGASALVAVLALAFAASAGANGPASHVLLAQDVYFPATPPTSEGVAQALLTITERARASGWPLKVAIFATPTDLGNAARLFTTPQLYADQLTREIGDPRLLVVTPVGFAGQKLGDGVDSALAALAPVAPGEDRLERQALTAVARLAREAGHPLVVPSIDTSERGRRPHRGAFGGHAGAPAVAPRSTADRDPSGATSPLVFIAPLAVVLLLLGARPLLARMGGERRRDPDEPA